MMRGCDKEEDNAGEEWRSEKGNRRNKRENKERTPKQKLIKKSIKVPNR